MKSLKMVFDGWDGHQTSLTNAIAPLSGEQLEWRPASHWHSAGELARHISLGRIAWFDRLGAPGSADLAANIDSWKTDRDGNRHIIEKDIPIAADAAALEHWLNVTWDLIERILAAWDTHDLEKSYRYTWNGVPYANSRQWTIWRVLSHDIHHGGQIALILGLQGIEAFELGDLFGHITLPPRLG